VTRVWRRSRVYYQGPRSDHFDGMRFFMPGAISSSKGMSDLMRWWWTEPRSRWPKWAPSDFSDRPPPRVGGSRLRVSFVGHASLLMQTGGLNLLIDPVWSARVSPLRWIGPRRVNDPGIAFSALPPIDAVLVSHSHYDHLDLATLSRLNAAHAPRVITPLGNDTIMRRHDPAIRAEAYDWGDEVTLSDTVAVRLAPMRHWSARSLSDRNRALWAAFILTTPAGRIYHVGDSGYGDGQQFRAARAAHGPFRLAVLPIGAYEPRWFMRDHHMDPQEAVAAFMDTGARLALAHHHGTFQLTNEAIEAPARELVQAREAAGIAPERFRLLRPGEVWTLED
jgi:L-ascorbate metabolism protein UlaG (beta-lactamase superfamily)